jgi:4-amino-4-deoxy-L-arabinose transferase-like glycosyltransferase
LLAPKPHKANAPTVLSLIVVAVYLAIALVQIGEPLVIDEMEFPRLAEGIADTGRPVYYRGEESPAAKGIYHPPLYAYTLGGWVAVFGFSEEVVRLFGVLLMIGTAWVGTRIVTALDVAGRWGQPLFLSLFLLHPYVIQSALLPDIDGTVLLFATVLLFYEVTRACRSDEGNRSSATRLGLALALAFAAKLTSVIVLPAVFLGLLVDKGVKRALTLTGSAVLIGLLVFLVIWWVVATLTGLAFSYPFEFTIQSGLKGGVAQTGIGELIQRLIPARYSTYWLGLLLPSLASMGTWIVVAQWRGRPDRRLAVMFAVWSIGVFLFFSVITGPPFGFPKYYIAALPTMAILGVIPMEWVQERVSVRRFAVLSGVLVLAVITGLGGWRFAEVSDDGRYSWPGPLWTVVLIALGAAGVTALIRFRGRWIVPMAIAAVFVATVSYNVSMAVVQAADTRSVRYFPGEVGFEETVRYLKNAVGPQEPILVPKDIGSATYNHYHEQERLFLQPDQLETVLDNADLKYAVVRTDWDYSYKIFPDIEPIIEEEMDLVETIGGFLIYRRSS